MQRGGNLVQHVLGVRRNEQKLVGGEGVRHVSDTVGTVPVSDIVYLCKGVLVVEMVGGMARAVICGTDCPQELAGQLTHGKAEKTVVPVFVFGAHKQPSFFFYYNMH